MPPLTLFLRGWIKTGAGRVSRCIKKVYYKGCVTIYWTCVALCGCTGLIVVTDADMNAAAPPVKGLEVAPQRIYKGPRALSDIHSLA